MFEETSDNVTGVEDVFQTHQSPVIRDINQYYLWALFAMGLPGNLLIAITVQSIQPLGLSSLLVSVVAMFDTLAIVFMLLDNQLLVNGVRLDPFMCKIIAVFNTFFSTLAVWTLVLLCAQQCLAVYFPTKKHQYLSKSRSCIILTVISFAIFAGLLVLYFVNTHSRFNVVRTCVEEQSMNYESLLVLESLHVILPYIMTAVLVTALHCGIGQFKQNYCAMFLQAGNSADSCSDERNCGNESQILINRDEEVTLVNLTRAAGTMFLFLSLAKWGYVVLTILSHFDVLNVNNHPDWLLFSEIENVMLDSTFCLKFLLYFFVSPTFRKHFVSRFLCH
ncbi:hypothetical protein Btru_054696 [Bulinus truncatus]|nr:hypothetical protein Btru_054696 [Bulinus truncatus]